MSKPKRLELPEMPKLNRHYYDSLDADKAYWLRNAERIQVHTFDCFWANSHNNIFEWMTPKEIAKKWNGTNRGLVEVFKEQMGLRCMSDFHTVKSITFMMNFMEHKVNTHHRDYAETLMYVSDEEIAMIMQKRKLNYENSKKKGE